jgi:hypothetical protein
MTCQPHDDRDQLRADIDAAISAAGPADAVGLALWWDAPNPAFGGRTPAQLLHSGDLEPLRRMLHRLTHPDPGT